MAEKENLAPLILGSIRFSSDIDCSYSFEDIRIISTSFSVLAKFVFEETKMHSELREYIIAAVLERKIESGRFVKRHLIWNGRYVMTTEHFETKSGYIITNLFSFCQLLGSV